MPSKIELSVKADGVQGEILGRGDEVLLKQSWAGKGTDFLIESGGGNYSLRWVSSARAKDDVPMLEVESRINVRWESPQDPLIAECLVTIEKPRGVVIPFASFTGAKLLDSIR